MKRLCSLFMFWALILTSYGQDDAGPQYFRYCMSESNYSVVYFEYKDSVALENFGNVSSFCLCDSNEFFVNKKVIPISDVLTSFPKKKENIHSVALFFDKTLDSFTWEVRYNYVSKKAKYKSWSVGNSWKDINKTKYRMMILNGATGELISDKKVKKFRAY